LFTSIRNSKNNGPKSFQETMGINYSKCPTLNCPSKVWTWFNFWLRILIIPRDINLSNLISWDHFGSWPYLNPTHFIIGRSAIRVSLSLFTHKPLLKIKIVQNNKSPFISDMYKNQLYVCSICFPSLLCSVDWVWVWVWDLESDLNSL
jgi:hypothetical protein